MTVKIRAMLPEDYESAYTLWRHSEGMGLNESDSREAIVQFLQRNPGLSQVAHLDADLIGTVLCGHDGRRGYLHHLAVAHRHRQLGIGSLLVETCLSNLASAGILKCHIFLHRDNEAGARFWRKIGWRARTDLEILSCDVPARGPKLRPGE